MGSQLDSLIARIWRVIVFKIIVYFLIFISSGAFMVMIIKISIIQFPYRGRGENINNAEIYSVQVLDNFQAYHMYSVLDNRKVSSFI